MKLLLDHNLSYKYYQRSKNVPKPTVEKCTRVNFGQTSDEEILSIFQNRGQTAGHYWREGTGFLIDLQHMRDHVESSGRRTPRNRQSRFTPAESMEMLGVTSKLR